MNIGEYIMYLRKKRDLSQRQLASLSKISNTEISRIESGERKKPSPDTLKAIAPHLGISYEELMVYAGYIEKTIEHKGYTEHTFYDDKGELVDIVRKAKEMHEKDEQWANTAYRVATELPEKDRKKVEEFAEYVLGKYKQDELKQEEDIQDNGE